MTVLWGDINTDPVIKLKTPAAAEPVIQVCRRNVLRALPEAGGRRVHAAEIGVRFAGKRILRSTWKLEIGGRSTARTDRHAKPLHKHLRNLNVRDAVWQRCPPAVVRRRHNFE